MRTPIPSMDSWLGVVRYLFSKGIFASFLLLSACMVGPNYKEPKTAVAYHWAKKDKSVKEAPFRQVTWWNVFHDPNLKRLIYLGYHHNISLQSAGVRVLQARAQLAQAVGALYPQQQAAAGSLSYYRLGGNYLQSVLPSTFYSSSLGLAANWEIDFWGKYRRAIQAKDAEFLSSLAAYDNALVTLTADIASDYIQIRMSESLIAVTQQNIDVQRMSLHLTESRFRSGEVSLLDVEQAKTELAETEAQLPELVSNLQSEKDALAILLGTVPNEVDQLLNKHMGIPHAPAHIAIGIPRETIARRPDIQQAREDAIQQMATVGQTKANLYPAFSLTGNFSFAGNTINGQTLGNMFNLSNFNIITGPALNWPILNYGQITNAVRAQDAVFQQALLNYVDLVLKAQKEVQDGITRYIEAKKTKRSLTQASTSAVKATQLTLIQYKEGEDQYTTVLYAEQQQLRVQTSLVKAQASVPLALVELYRALGGGWQIRKGSDIVPYRIKEEMAARTDWGHLLEESNHTPPMTKKQRFKQLYLPNW